MASAEQPLPAIRRPRPGWSEQDASAWWPATVAALREALSGAAGTIYPDLTAATRAMVRPPRMIEPDSATRNALEDGYRRWTEALRRRGWLD